MFPRPQVSVLVASLFPSNTGECKIGENNRVAVVSGAGVTVLRRFQSAIFLKDCFRDIVFEGGDRGNVLWTPKMDDPSIERCFFGSVRSRLIRHTIGTESRPANHDASGRS